MENMENNNQLPESKDEVKVERDESLTGKFQLVNPFSNIREAGGVEERFEKGITPIPPGRSDEIDKIYNVYKDDGVGLEDLYGHFGGTQEEWAQDGLRLIENIKTASSIHQGEYGSKILEEKPYNSVEFANENISLREVKVSSVNPSSLKMEDRLNRFKALLGAGTTVSIPLYHSGFRIILSSPTISELIQLEVEVLKNTVQTGRETIGFITSNRRGFGVESIREFIISKTIASTLDVDKEDIFSYVSILDLDAILLGLMTSTYVNKISVSRSCCNSIKTNDEGGVICDKVVNADLDPYKLLFVNRRLIDGYMMSIISRRKAKSVSLEDYEAYQRSLNNVLTTENKRSSVAKFSVIGEGRNYELTFRIPTIDQYVKDATLWLDSLTASVDRIASVDGEINKNQLMDKIITSKIIGMLNSNVSGIEISDDDGNILEREFEDRFVITDMLDFIVSSGDQTPKVIESITDYVNKSLVGLVATPNYVCPKCQSLQTDQCSTAKDFSELIPLNMLDFFFSLLGDRNQRREVESNQSFSML